MTEYEKQLIAERSIVAQHVAKRRSIYYFKKALQKMGLIGG